MMKYIPLLAVLSMMSPASFARTADDPTAPGARDMTGTYTTTGASASDTTVPATGVRKEPLTPEAGVYHADTAGRVLPGNDGATTSTGLVRPGMDRDGTPGIAPADPDVPVIYRTVPETGATSTPAPGMNNRQTTPGAGTAAAW